MIYHEVTRGTRQKLPARRNRYNVKGRCEIGGGEERDPCVPCSHRFLHRLAYMTGFRKGSANSCAALTPAQAESYLIIALSSFLDNTVSVLGELIVKRYLNEYSISLLRNKSSALHDVNIDQKTHHSHLISKLDRIILSSGEKPTLHFNMWDNYLARYQCFGDPKHVLIEFISPKTSRATYSFPDIHKIIPVCPWAADGSPAPILGFSFLLPKLCDTVQLDSWSNCQKDQIINQNTVRPRPLKYYWELKRKTAPSQEFLVFVLYFLCLPPFPQVFWKKCWPHTWVYQNCNYCCLFSFLFMWVV